MVYNGTKSGLNDAMWAPWFALPTVEGHLCFITAGTYMGDIDVSDIFLNFVMHEKLQEYAGIDLTSLFPEELLASGDKVIWERWTRCGMGFRDSLLKAVQAMLMAEEVIRGDNRETANIFRWSHVKLNLPGDLDYQPWRPWVMKLQGDWDKIACDFISYVDDVRAAGNDCIARCASQRVASVLNWLGVQDVTRKRRDPSQTPGPWAVSICHQRMEQCQFQLHKKGGIKQRK
jgi:hypothetical protein